MPSLKAKANLFQNHIVKQVNPDHNFIKEKPTPFRLTNGSFVELGLFYTNCQLSTSPLPGQKCPPRLLVTKMSRIVL